MRYRVNLHTVILLFIASILFQGCLNGLGLQAGSQEELTLKLCPTELSEMNPAVRSVTEDVIEGDEADYKVSDFWVFEYDEAGNILGAPRYYLSKDYADAQSVPVSVIVPNKGGVIYKLVIIANTHNQDLLSSISYNSIQALKSSSLPVNSSEDLYQRAGESHDLLMNGVVDLMSGTTGAITCPLYRNVAKLVLRLTNGPSTGITLNSVQLKSVPDRMFYADRLYAAETKSPDPSKVQFISLERDEINIAQGGAPAELTYYLPRNMRGTNLSTTEAGKNVNAPENASYLEIRGVRDSGMPIIYKFYLGANNINDFNIEPNHIYKLNLDFHQLGDPNDNRIEDMSVVLFEDSNSYMVDLYAGPVKYMVPIENRINTYWTSESGKKNPDWEDYLVSGSQEWVAEVIWQDLEGVELKFANEDGSYTDTYRGLLDDRYFSFVLTDVDHDALGGNVVIGVRSGDSEWNKAKDGYMWSWHIWVTDYNPYEYVGVWQEGKYEYEVPGGSLHRYSSMDAIPMYKNKYMMDRNFGAKGHRYEDGYTKCAGVFYQYGRKDPFPVSGTAALLRTNQSGEGVMIYQSVNSPLTYYKGVGGYVWNEERTYDAYSWSDLNKMVKDGVGKSFFDPCPPGWRLPTNKVWSHFGTSTEAYASNWPSPSWSGNISAGWLLYLTGSQKTGPTSYFPASGMIGRDTGNYTSYGSSGSMWQAEVSYFYYSNTANLMIDPDRGPTANYRAMGLPVRCISE